MGDFKPEIDLTLKAAHKILDEEKYRTENTRLRALLARARDVVRNPFKGKDSLRTEEFAAVWKDIDAELGE